MFLILIAVNNCSPHFKTSKKIIPRFSPFFPIFRKKTDMKRIFSYFLQGVLIISPLAITGYVIYKIFNFVDSLFIDQLTKLTGIKIPGLSIILLFTILTLLGLIAHTIIARPFKLLYERLMNRAPLFKTIYTSLNDLFSAFVGKERKFNIPVLVLINKENDIWRMGFMTQKSMAEFGIEKMVAVYFPHSYAFSGELAIVHENSIKQINLPPAEVMKFIISGGVTKVL
jgi:uncharacterized membrane protein